MSLKALTQFTRRLQFVKLALKAQRSMAQLCRLFRISRKCGYKWKHRFEQHGRPGLVDRPRRPERSPRRTSQEWLKRIRRMRRRHRSWRTRKLRARLLKEYKGQEVPAVRTIGRWLQRVVSNTRWAAGLTVDSAGPVQPLPAEYPIVARSTVGSGAKNLFAIVWTLRLPGGHPRGQRRTVWIDWPSGSFAIERLVDSIGDFGGIHRARPSRTECWARTNASSVEGRADSAALEQPAGAATTDRSVGRGVQPASASRSAGAENSLRALPSTSSGPEEEQHEISAGMVGAEGAEQRADQVARTKAICGGSLRWVSRGFEAGQKEMGDVFWAIADWRTLGNRCGCNATSQVCSRPKTRSTFRPQIGREAGASTNDVRERTSSHALRAVPLRGECYRTHRYAAPPAGRSAAGGRGRRKCYPCPGLKCYPCPGPPPTRALSLGRG